MLRSMLAAPRSPLLRYLLVGALVQFGCASPSWGGEKFPLGSIGGTAEVEVGSAEAVITALTADAAGMQGGLQVGDRIVAIDGTKFVPHSAKVDDGGRGAQRSLGEAIDAHGGKTLKVSVVRKDETLEIDLALPDRPSFGRGFPKGDRAALAMRRAAAAQLVAAQRKNGMWNSPVGLTGDRVVSAWALLSLLADGDPLHHDAIERGARWLRGPNGHAWIGEDPLQKGPDNLGNWALTTTAAALAEHRLKTKNDDDLPVIERCVQTLVARMTKEGRFGHDVSVGYSGKGFNVINTQAHWAWALAAEVGVPIDETAWQLSFSQVEESVSKNGGVRYWTIAGTGTADGSLRTGSMALGLAVSGRAPKLAERFARYLARFAPRAREAHAVGSMGMMVSAPALWALHRPGYQQFMEEWRWYLALMWGPDDRIAYLGGKKNNGGDSYLGFETMACIIALQMLCCPDENLRMHQKPRSGKESSEKRLSP